MTIATPTPDGPARCCICGATPARDSEGRVGEPLCDRCERLLLRFTDRHSRGPAAHRVLSLRTEWLEVPEDSVSLIELVLELEQEMGVNPSQEELDRMRTVGDVLRYLTDPQRRRP
jgi:hypothetical protein